MPDYTHGRTPEERFLNKIKIDEQGCWVWQGKKNSGYGIIKMAGKERYVHRAMYEDLHGELPVWTIVQVDHLCGNRACCNPDHLEAVTTKENGSRAGTNSRTHCRRGHEFTPENTYYHKSGNGRTCLTCQRERTKKRPKRSPEKSREYYLAQTPEQRARYAANRKARKARKSEARGAGE